MKLGHVPYSSSPLPVLVDIFLVPSRSLYCTYHSHHRLCSTSTRFFYQLLCLWLFCVSVCVSLSVFHFFPCFLIHVRFLSFFLSFFSLALSLRRGEASICIVIPVGAKDGREEVWDRFVANWARPSSVHTGFILFFSLSFFLLLPIYFESISCVVGKRPVLPLRTTDDGLRWKKGNRSAPIFCEIRLHCSRAFVVCLLVFPPPSLSYILYIVATWWSFFSWFPDRTQTMQILLRILF